MPEGPRKLWSNTQTDTWHWDLWHLLDTVVKGRKRPKAMAKSWVGLARFHSKLDQQKGTDWLLNLYWRKTELWYQLTELVHTKRTHTKSMRHEEECFSPLLFLQSAVVCLLGIICERAPALEKIEGASWCRARTPSYSHSLRSFVHLKQIALSSSPKSDWVYYIVQILRRVKMPQVIAREYLFCQKDPLFMTLKIHHRNAFWLSI